MNKNEVKLENLGTVNRKMTKTYRITGLVYGRYWGGGEGSYRSATLSGSNKSYLLKQANKRLDDGTLDSGMGYESLLGALLNIETITTMEQKGREFKRSDYETVYIGKLNDKQKDFLDEVLLYH